MLKLMNELDEVWAQKLNQAISDAQTAGRTDIADYLTLKAANDLLRQTSVKWLFDSMTEIAAFANRANVQITLETDTPHNFEFAKANMVGARLRLLFGVRCLTLEAGWTRTPSDGFMRGGALAAARFLHFGMTKQNEEIILLREADAPQWFSVNGEGRRAVFNSIHLQKHFETFRG
ncbi:hypothetical protein BH10ACI1_BH10ACI1_27080 [soil metagenome]